MKLPGSWTICMLIMLMAISTAVDARRLALRPLSLKELRRALRESGQLDDTPAGRSVASALAGIKGFALGITKGVGGSILFDVVTSNATLEYVSNLLSSSSSSSSDSGSSGTAQEICFRSRSADGDLIQGRSSNNNDEEEERATGTVSGTTPTTTTGTATGTGGSNGLTCIVLNKDSTKRRRRDTKETVKTFVKDPTKRLKRSLRQRLVKRQH